MSFCGDFCVGHGNAPFRGCACTRIASMARLQGEAELLCQQHAEDRAAEAAEYAARYPGAPLPQVMHLDGIPSTPVASRARASLELQLAVVEPVEPPTIEALVARGRLLFPAAGWAPRLGQQTPRAVFPRGPPPGTPEAAAYRERSRSRSTPPLSDRRALTAAALTLRQVAAHIEAAASLLEEAAAEV